MSDKWPWSSPKWMRGTTSFRSEYTQRQIVYWTENFAVHELFQHDWWGRGRYGGTSRQNNFCGSCMSFHSCNHDLLLLQHNWQYCTTIYSSKTVTKLLNNLLSIIVEIVLQKGSVHTAVDVVSRHWAKTSWYTNGRCAPIRNHPLSSINPCSRYLNKAFKRLPRGMSSIVTSNLKHLLFP